MWGYSVSIEAIAWAFKKVHLDDPTAKFVLIAICNYSDDENKAWPSLATIGSLTGLSRRTIQNSMKRLEDLGLIRRERRERSDGSDSSSICHIAVGTEFTIAPPMESPAPPRAPDSIGGVQEMHGGIAADAPLEPSLNRQLEPSTNLPMLALGDTRDGVEAVTLSPKEQAELFFDKKFWPAYPKRFGSNPKDPARKKIVAAILKGENPQKILAGVNRLYSGLQRSGKLGTEYVPMALTWINRKQWKDDPLPSGTGKSPNERSFFEIAQDLLSEGND